MEQIQNKFSRRSLLSWLSPAGATLILFCFFLPWLEVHCSGKKIIGSGFDFAQKAAPLWLIPAFAMLVLLLFVWYWKGLSLKWFKIFLVSLAAMGILMLVFTYISIEQKLSGFIVRRITSHQIKNGLIGTVVGFVLIVISAVGLRTSRKS
ncbi:MAG TPA: hypothetical protein VGD14_08160 [bacterium]